MAALFQIYRIYQKIIESFYLPPVYFLTKMY